MFKLLVFFFSTKKFDREDFLKRRAKKKHKNSLLFIWFYNTPFFILFRTITTFMFLVAVGLLVCRFWHKYIDKCIYMSVGYRIWDYGFSIIYFIKRVYRLFLFIIIMPYIFYLGYYFMLNMETLNYNRYKIVKEDHLSLIVIYTFWIYFWFSDNDFFFPTSDNVDFWDHWFFVNADVFLDKIPYFFPKTVDYSNPLILDNWPCVNLFWNILIYFSITTINFFSYSPNVTIDFIEQRRIILLFFISMTYIAATIEEKFIGLAKVLG